MNYRFSRLELALGKKAVDVLKSSHVTVVGIGGVGGIAAETLVRSALGHIHLIDTDSYQQTDINRQLFALESTIGQTKVTAARQRLLDIHPNLDIAVDHAFFHTDTAEKLLNPAPDFVIDAIDAVLPKIELLCYCVNHAIPVISVMGAAVRSDYRNILVSDISKTKVCPLARVIRRRLVRRGIRKGIMCIYSAEPGPPSVPSDQNLDDNIRTGHTRGRIRPILGSYGPMISIFGILAADFVIRSLIRQFEEV
ncbi:ThiF family adenylyltransferase [bacterium]|nr:ThiF family adenylyltransferase [candidate division CSSED10-310 bacterium]